MFSFLTYLFALLVPILLILIVRLKRRRTVLYSHTYLRSFEDEKPLDYLLRIFRIYHDVLFDLIIALVLALFFARILSFTPRHTAVCIDGSYSMIRGDDQNALRQAVSWALEERTDAEKPVYSGSGNPKFRPERTGPAEGRSSGRTAKL